MVSLTQAARRDAGESRIAQPAAKAIRSAISLAGGNEVCFVGTLDEDNIIVQARVVARGDLRSVLALPGFAQAGEMLLHNHPSGLLDPSDADRLVDEAVVPLDRRVSLHSALDGGDLRRRTHVPRVDGPQDASAPPGSKHV